MKNFAEQFTNTEKIQNDTNYDAVNLWVKKTRKSYKSSAITSVILSILLTAIISVFLKNKLGIILTILISIIMLAIYSYALIFAGWGMVTMKMHFKEVAKSAWKAARYGYKVGETIKTTNVNVSHEFGNTYKVTARTEDKGVLFACIGVMVILLAWSAYCVYKGTFLTFKKIRNSKVNLEEYIKSKN